jgi:hypothetical protein
LKIKQVENILLENWINWPHELPKTICF